MDDIYFLNPSNSSKYSTRCNPWSRPCKSPSWILPSNLSCRKGNGVIPTIVREGETRLMHLHVFVRLFLFWIPVFYFIFVICVVLFVCLFFVLCVGVCRPICVVVVVFVFVVCLFVCLFLFVCFKQNQAKITKNQYIIQQQQM